MPNFPQCAANYLANGPISEYAWKHPVRIIEKNETTQVSYQGCLALCGRGTDWYDWSQASQTITTWILPIVGILLQAPLESNAFWRTVLAISRWLGSPMSSLSYILWNISVSGKCALMVDMAVRYEALYTHSEDFKSIRDSFYILMAMNQFQVKTLPYQKQEAEGLLRIVLFSKDLSLIEYVGTQQIKRRTLAARREKLAEGLRKKRRRGVVPVFVSTLWFLFALALSIQGAFGLVGQNATAHDLALGLLMGWLPILVLSSIIDRNPLSADDVRDELNSLIHLVCTSLQDKEVVNEYLTKYCAGEDTQNMQKRVQDIVRHVESLDSGNFFASFAGQGRTRWHYGVAHPILSDLENVWIAEHGRDWLRDENAARNKLVLGSADRGLFWFDWRQLWHISSAIVIVAGSGLGAFILSYFTPTVGLGCRSQGYLIFNMIALGLLILEFLIWRSTSEEREAYNAQKPNNGRRSTMDLHVGDVMRQASVYTMKRTRSWLERPLEFTENFVRKWYPIVFSKTYIGDRQHRREHLQRLIDGQFRDMRHFSSRQWWNVLVFIPAELINTAWLCKVILAQTFGAYQNCWCQVSPYSPGGGYLDFYLIIYGADKYVKWSWALGTAISSLVLLAGLAYIVLEWCLQSHISTLDDNDAREGLQRTRAFRRYTTWLRRPLQWLVLHVNELWYLFNPPDHKQKTLVWRKDPTYVYGPELTEVRQFSVTSYNAEQMYDPPPAPPMAYGRLRSNSDIKVSGHGADATVPHIIEPGPSQELKSFRFRAYSDASSDKSSTDVARKPVPTSFLEPDNPLLGPMSWRLSEEHLRPRPPHTRQGSDEMTVVLNVDHDDDDDDDGKV